MTTPALSEATLRFIRSTPTSARILADGYRIPKRVIYAIKNGSYRAPDLDDSPPAPRRIGATCDQCKHWSGRCGLGFPDANAVDCAAFMMI
jgi:hypothetical protein